MIGFLTRLVRLHPAAVVRLRPVGPVTQLWAMLPFGVLVSHEVPSRSESDITVDAASLLVWAREGGPSPGRRDEAWRWPLPPAGAEGRVVETVPAREVVRVAAAAARTLRTGLAEGVGGRAVGERALRDALLDHVPIVVTGADGERVEVPQRLVQAVVQLGFLGHTAAGEQQVTVRVLAGWTILDGMHGSGWFRPVSGLGLGRS